MARQQFRLEAGIRHGAGFSAAGVADQQIDRQGGNTRPFDLGAGQPERGLLVVGVTSGSPADAAGVLVGDVMLEFDRRPVESPEELLTLLVGDRVGLQAHVR